MALDTSTTPSPVIEAQTIFESSEILARYRSGFGSRQLVVTFSPVKSKPTRDRIGFGQSFLDKYGYDAVHVTCAGNHWYQYACMPDLLAAIAEVAKKYQSVVTYGSSMGAYQAIKAAGAIGADRCIAISPQYTVDPAKAPWENRWPTLVKDIDFIDDKLTGAQGVEYIVVYDPWEALDRRHVDLIRQEVPLTEIRLPFGSHNVANFLAEAGVLSELTIALIEGRSYQQDHFRGKIRTARRKSATYLINVARRGSAPLAWRTAWLQKAAELAPEDPHALSALATAYLMLGEYEGARVLAHRAVKLAPDKASYRIVLAKVFEKLGRPEKAQQHAGKALQAEPYNVKAMMLAPPAMRPTGMVVSNYRTGTHALLYSLREAGLRARHMHYLEPNLPEPQTEEERAQYDAQLESEAWSRSILVDNAARHILFTVRRKPADRLMSGVWYANHKTLKRLHERNGGFDDETLLFVKKKLVWLLEQDRAYGERVYKPLGLPENPQPGRYRTIHGAPAFVLDFANLAQEFAEATKAAYGVRVPLLRVNEGEWIGGELYAEFRKFWAERVEIT